MMLTRSEAQRAQNFTRDAAINDCLYAVLDTDFNSEATVTNTSELSGIGVIGYTFPFQDIENQEFLLELCHYNDEIKDSSSGQMVVLGYYQYVAYCYLPPSIKIRILMCEVANALELYFDVPLIFRLALTLYSNSGLTSVEIFEEALSVILGYDNFSDCEQMFYARRLTKHKLVFNRDDHLIIWYDVIPKILEIIKFIDKNPGFLTIVGVFLNGIVTELNIGMHHDENEEVKFSVGMWGIMQQQPNGLDRVPRRDRVVNAGARRHGGGRLFGPFPPGDRRHINPNVPVANNFIVPHVIPAPVLENERDQIRVAGWWNEEHHKLKSGYMASDFPRNRCLFTLQEVSDNTYNHESLLFDPCGSPFCGLTAIDLAVGEKPNVDNYLRMCKFEGSSSAIGTNVFLRSYAFNKGVNIRFIIPVINGDQTEIQNLDYMNNPSWKWVILVVVNNDGSWIRREADNQGVLRDGIKHVYMVIDSVSSTSNLEVPLLVLDNPDLITPFLMGLLYSLLQVLFIRFVTHYFIPWVFPDFSRFLTFVNNILKGVYPRAHWIVSFLFYWVSLLDEIVLLTYGFFSWLPHVKWQNGYKFKEYRYHGSDLDRRTVRERRDNIESQDHYAVFSSNMECLFHGQRVFEMPNVTNPHDIIVSVVRANQLYKELQCCPSSDLTISMLSVLKSNYANSDEGIPNLYANTIKYVKWLVERTSVQHISPEYYTQAYNAPGHTAYVGNLNLVAINQFAVSVGRSVFSSMQGEFLITSKRFNHLIRDNLGVINNGFKVFKEQNLKIKPRKVVSYCPLGSLITDQGQLGPGHLCVTEPYSILGALSGRGMCKIPVEVQEFFEFSHKEVDRLLSMTDVPAWTNEDPVDNFIENNRGKRSRKYIQSKVDQYNDCLQGKSNKKYFQNSCFVKFEDSSKVVNGKTRVRPRLIMTMSDYFSMVLSPLVQVVHTWNESYISKYQVKNLSPEEFVEKVASFTNKEHIVTDYSAFESSVSYMFKLIEDYFAVQLLTKMRMFRTLEHFQKLNKFGRVLHSPIGKFMISSRCSGDYFTSTFNCLINYLINAYSCYKLSGGYLDLIVEGDDGLTKPSQIDSKLINSMGFGFSSNVKGSKPGDVDFLRKRWLHDNSYISIGRALKNLFWVNSQQTVKPSRQRAILRAKALSYYFSSPGCPVVTSAINYILKNTSGANYFVGLEKYMSYNDKFDVKKIGKNYGTIPINESMRGPISEGATGFPPIPVVIQLELEKRFEKGEFYVGSLLSDYDDISVTAGNHFWYNDSLESVSDELLDVIEIVRQKVTIEDKVDLVLNKYNAFSVQDLVDVDLLHPRF